MKPQAREKTASQKTQASKRAVQRTIAKKPAQHPVQNPTQNPTQNSVRQVVKKQGRTNDPARTMAEIMQVATQEFAENGLAGARIDRIAELTRTSKRMIYYYFGSKEGLYVAVLEESYRQMRATESQLQLDDLPPEAALKHLVEFTFDHHFNDQQFIRLVMSENINRGSYLAQSKSIQRLNVPAIHAVRSIYERGCEQGLFRPGIDPLDIHATISALSFFNVSNQYTFGIIFKFNMAAYAEIARRRTVVVQTVLKFVER
jgi:AcrR family transcriptional regulator